jgi:hypothetical protein
VLSGCAGGFTVSEKMMWSTYPMVTQKGAATGFVVNHTDRRAPGGKVAVIFTSAHMLETVGKGPLVIGVRIPGDTGETEVVLMVINPVALSGGERFYVRHPSHDLAAFALPLPPELADVVALPSFLDERVLAADRRALHSGAEVAFVGYPEVLPGTEGAFPVLRSGRVASYPVGTPQAQGRFLINSDVYPGDSGAPVFLASRNGRPQLVGVIIQRIGLDSRSFSHLAVAVDAKVIRETLEILASKEVLTAPPYHIQPGKTKP